MEGVLQTQDLQIPWAGHQSQAQGGLDAADQTQSRRGVDLRSIRMQP